MKHVIIILFLILTSNLKPDIDERYEQIIAEAEYYLNERNFNATTIKLQKLEASYSELDFRFYKLLGDLFLLEERKQDALVSYTQSLKLNPNQTQIAKWVYKFYLENREIQKAFDILRLYLSNEKADLDARFDSLILSARLGDKKYYNYAIKRIRDFSEVENQEQLSERLKRLESQKKWKELEDLSFYSIKLFPQNQNFYRYALVSLSKQKYNSEKLEFLLVSQTAIFPFPKYSLELAQFYEKENRKFEALNLYRITFFRALENKKFNLEEEILILLRNWYYSMKWEKEAIETSELIELIRMKENLPLEKLENRIRVTKNREYITLALFLLKDKDVEKYKYYKSFLKKRDEENWNRDFHGIFPVFFYEEY